MHNYLAFSHYSSAKVTWKNGRGMSQLDHIFMTSVELLDDKSSRKKKDTVYEMHFSEKVQKLLDENETENSINKTAKIFRFIKSQKPEENI